MTRMIMKEKEHKDRRKMKKKEEKLWKIDTAKQNAKKGPSRKCGQHSKKSKKTNKVGNPNDNQ